MSVNDDRQQRPSDDAGKARHPDTEVIHRGEGAHPQATPLTTPIYATSTFTFDAAADLADYQHGKNEKYIYSRYANPTVRAAELKIAILEDAEDALVTSSGMAAITSTCRSLDCCKPATKWCAAPRFTAGRCKSFPTCSAASA